MSLKTATHITSDGKMQGESTTTATGSFSLMLRQVAPRSRRRVLNAPAGHAPPSRHDRYRHVRPCVPTRGLSASYAITAHYDGQPNVPWVSAKGIRCPPAFACCRCGDALVGPLFNRNLPPSEPTPCWSGTAVEDLSIEAPPGKHFAKLPPDTDVTTDNLSFTARWKQTERVVSVHREFKSKMNHALCTDELRTTTAGALSKIAAAYPLQISLADD